MSELQSLRPAARARRRLLLTSASLGILAAGQGVRRTTRAVAAAAAVGTLLAPVVVQAHTDSLGYIITAGDAAGSYDVEIVYGSYHCANPSLCLNTTGGTPVAAEGSVDLKLSDGTEVATQPFSILLADVADGTLPAGLVPGENYFYADGSGLSGTRPTGFEGTYTFQSATFLDLTPGTYTFGYASNALSQNWLPLNDAINAGTFTISADGTISIPGVGSDMQSGEAYASSDLGSTVNPVFKGGTLSVDQNGETYAQNFTLDNSGTNTIDMAGNGTTLSGSFSDADPSQPGGITFEDSGGGGQVTLTGINTQTGGTTLDSGTLAMAGEGTLGADTNITTVNGGTLDLGGTAQVQAALNQNGGTIEDGSIAVGTYTLTDGQVASNATINASSGFDVYNGQIDGTLTGTGALDKLGAGTVVLTGTNDYSGGTTISGGILQLGNGGTTGSIVGNIVNNGTLVVDRSNALALDGAISGTGGLVQAGTGTTTLSGPNSYDGGTYVQDGTLTLAGEGTLGAATGSTFVSGGTLDLGGTAQQQVSLVQTGGLVDNGRADVGTYHLLGGELGASATVDASDAFDVRSGLVSGTLTGTGALIKSSGGTVILAGDNDYSGGTTIERGTLVVGNGGTTGSITGDVANNGSLIFDRSNEVTFDGAVSGSGSLTQAGSGTLILTEDSDYSGGTTISGGVLQLGNGGTTGSIAGDVADNSMLVVDRSNAVALDGAISGSGALVQGGTGTTTLSGPNSYEGGTYIEGGTLALAGEGTLGSATGSTFITGGTLDLGGTNQQQASLVQAGGVVDNGTANVGTYHLFFGELGAGATVDASDAFDVRHGLVSGTLTGTGTLVKSSPGIVVLAGNNDYSGGTTIEDGALVLGNGGTAGSITGDVTNDGVLAFNRSDDATFGGAISGSGLVAQIGDGSTRLADGNSYTGGTFIANGTLIGSASSFGTGPILDNAALVIDQAEDADFSNALGGTGSLTKTGAGTLDLVTDSSLSGPTTLAQGGLAVNASFADSAFTAESGTILSGNGTLGGLTVRNGATLATGNNGIGTLGVAGDVQQESGSNWQVQLASTGETDRVIASGKAQIGDGAILTVTKVDGQRYALDANYTVLAAAGGVTGRYTLAGDTRISAFFDLVGNYNDPDVVFLEATQTRQFNALDGLSRNQGAAAGGAQSLGLGNSLFNAIAYLDSESEARNAFDQISGEVYSSVKSDAIEDSRFLREAVDLRLRSSTGGVVGQTVDEQTGADSPAKETGISVWGHGFGAWGHLGGDGNAAQLHRSIGGFFMGADAAVAENWRVGVLGGYSHSEFHATGRSSNGNSDNYHVGIYGGGNVGPIGIRAGAAYTWQELDVDRSIGFTGFSGALSANTREQTAQLFGEAGYRIDLNGGSWEPFAQLAYVHLHSKGFTEAGGAAALSGDSDNTNVTFSTVGLRASKTLTAAGTASLYGSLGWRHAFGDRTPLTTLHFASGSDAFTVAGTPIAEDAAALEAGVDTKLGKGLSLGVAYSGQLSSHLNDHGVKATIGWKF